MIRSSKDCETEIRVNMKGGDGSVEMTNFVSKADLNNNGRMFGTIVLKKDCGIGYHVHNGESELFYIMKGNAIYNDNGTEVEVHAGDITICPSGSGHGIKNVNDETVELIAVIVNA